MKPITIVNRCECPVIAILGLKGPLTFLTIFIRFMASSNLNNVMFQISKSGYKLHKLQSSKLLCKNTSCGLGRDYVMYIVGVLFLINFYFTISHIIKVT